MEACRFNPARAVPASVGVLERLGWAVLVLHLFLSPLLFANDTAETVESVKATLLIGTGVVLAMLGLWSWIGRADRHAALTDSLRELVREPIAVGVVLFLISATLSTIFSISPRTSYWGNPHSEGGWLTLLGYVLLFFSTRWLCRDAVDARRLLSVACAAAAIASTYALVQVAHADPIVWDETSNLGLYVRPFGTMGHPNFLAAYLVMVFPILVDLAERFWQRRQWFCLAVLVTAGVLVCCAIGLTLSRAAWVAFACVLVLFGASWFCFGKGRRVVVTLATVIALAAIAFSIACLLTPHGTELVKGLGGRARSFTQADSRQHIWHVALDLFRDHPWLGCGVDTFHLAFGQKRPLGYWYTEWNTTPLRAHNIGLHLLATQGIVGVLAGLVFLVGLVVALARAWRRAGTEAKTLLVIVTAGLTGFFVQNLVSFTVVGLGTLFVTYAAILSRLAAESTPAAGRRSRQTGRASGVAGVMMLALFLRNVGSSDKPLDIRSVLAIVGLVFAGGLILWALRRLDADAPGSEPVPDGPSPPSPIWTRMANISVGVAGCLLLLHGVINPLRASVACRQGDRWLANAPARAAEKYASAVELAPERPTYIARVGGACLACAKLERDPTQRRDCLLQARAAFERAISMVPMNAYYHAGLGRTLMELARLRSASADEVCAAYDRALTLDPHHAYYWADAANAALVLNQLDRARAYAEQGLSLYPHFGILRAHVGYVALVEKRYADAVPLLTEALASSWYLEESGKRFAGEMLDKARRQLAVSQHPPPGSAGQRRPSKPAGRAASAFE